MTPMALNGFSRGPRFPIPIPNNGKNTQIQGDQKQDNATDGTVHSSHNGGQYPYANRPTNKGGTAARDLYVWAED